MIKIFIVGSILALLLSACAGGSPNPQGILEIHDIQGCSHTSPYTGKTVTAIIGVVTHKISNGFTMQSVTPDDKACTSEGLFVFTEKYPGVMVGDLVKVNGLVEEFTEGNAEDHNLSQTEIVQPVYTIVQSDHDLPEPIVLDGPDVKIPTELIENDEMVKFDSIEDGLDFYESLESMLVEITSGTVVGPKNSYDEIVVLPDVFTNFNLISNHGALIRTESDSNPEKTMVKLPANYDVSVNVGDRFDSHIIGILDYSYGNFKVLAFPPVEFTSSEQFIDTFETREDGITIATYNLENLSPLDETGKYKEISKQVVKILQSPDVLVLNEIMDNSGSVDDGIVEADQTIQKLIKAIKKAGGPTYSYSNMNPNNNQDGGIGGGNIRTILLFRSDKGINLEEKSPRINGVKYQEGYFSIEQNPLLVGEFSSAFNGTRKPRIWLLNQNGKQFFVVGVHLTSQGANSPEWGNQQPPQKPEEVQRIEQASLINQQLAKIHLSNPSIPIFIVGDFNDSPWSDTIAAIKQDIFDNSADLNTPAENYSYIYEGNAQQLDYILINKNLAINLLQARFIHHNSILDQQENISDHDPLIIEYLLDQSAP